MCVRQMEREIHEQPRYLGSEHQWEGGHNLMKRIRKEKKGLELYDPFILQIAGARPRFHKTCRHNEIFSPVGCYIRFEDPGGTKLA